MASINDVPDDQGGRVMVDLKRPAYDHASEIDHPVTQYGVYRRLTDVNKVIDFGKIGNSDMPEEVAGLSNWSDETPEPWVYFYQVSAVDHAGNECPTGSVAGVTDVPAAGVHKAQWMGHDNRGG